MARQQQRERIPVNTSLYAEKDLALLQEIWDMQSSKTYMKTFREAFRLILSLRRRNTSVLFELFPWIQNQPVNTTQLNFINYQNARILELEQEVQTLKENQQTRV
jgi:hypothetical protein